MSSRTLNVLRAYGARKLASGIGILADPHDAKWLWSRVGGDAVDLVGNHSRVAKPARPGM